jgi:hypothetical protein
MTRKKRRIILFIICILIIGICINYQLNKRVLHEFIAPFSQRQPQIAIRIYSHPTLVTEKCNNNNLTLLIIINSIPSDTHLRRAIRETWAAHDRRNYEIIFILGEHPNIIYNLIYTFLLSYEQYLYGDLLLTNIREHFYHLPLKTFTILYWSSRYCSFIKCLLKTDSDVIVFPHNLLNLCRVRTHEHINVSKIYGHCWEGAKVCFAYFVQNL